MQMTHTNIESLSSAASYLVTDWSCRQKPFGLLRPDTNHALAGGCSR